MCACALVVAAWRRDRKADQREEGEEEEVGVGFGLGGAAKEDER